VPREAVERLLFATCTNVFAWIGLGTMAMKFVTVGRRRTDRLHHADLGYAVRAAGHACAADPPGLLSQCCLALPASS
jgi:hypothetical protein